ncbi:MAG: outer membrane beta-barrel protein [Flavobacteriales bacterium]
MKRLFTLISLLSVTYTFAQSGKASIGFHTNLPIGETQDVTQFGISINPSYVFPVSKHLDLGISSEFSFFKGKTFRYNVGGQALKHRYNNSSYIPISTAMRYHLSDVFSVGTDIGYAITLQKENKNGLYFKPRISYKLDKHLALNLGYVALRVNGGTWKTVQIGAEYKF